MQNAQININIQNNAKYYQNSTKIQQYTKMHILSVKKATANRRKHDKNRLKQHYHTYNIQQQKNNW